MLLTCKSHHYELAFKVLVDDMNATNRKYNHNSYWGLPLGVTLMVGLKGVDSGAMVAQKSEEKANIFWLVLSTEITIDTILTTIITASTSDE